MSQCVKCIVRMIVNYIRRFLEFVGIKILEIIKKTATLAQIRGGHDSDLSNHKTEFLPEYDVDSFMTSNSRRCKPTIKLCSFSCQKLKANQSNESTNGYYKRQDFTVLDEIRALRYIYDLDKNFFRQESALYCRLDTLMEELDHVGNREHVKRKEIFTNIKKQLERRRIRKMSECSKIVFCGDSRDHEDENHVMKFMSCDMSEQPKGKNVRRLRTKRFERRKKKETMKYCSKDIEEQQKVRKKTNIVRRVAKLKNEVQDEDEFVKVVRSGSKNMTKKYNAALYNIDMIESEQIGA